MIEQYSGLNGYLGSTDRAVLLANGTGGLTAQASSLTLSANNCLTIPGSTLTASEPLLNLSQIWNNAGVAFTGIKFNATDTASASDSLLADFQVGGSSKFSVDKTGVVTVAGRSTGVAFASSGTTGFGFKSNRAAWFYQGTLIGALSNNGIEMLSSMGLGWSTSVIDGNCDLWLYRDAANTLALRNGVNAQAFNIYNTWGNSGADYERLFVGWTGNYCYLTTQKAGTGFARSIIVGTEGVTAMYLRTGGLDRWSVSSLGHFTAVTDNAYDIGASGAARPRHVYAGTDVVSPKFVATSPQTYAATNVTTDRTYDANATTVDELADIVGTLISDLRTLGLVA